MRHPLSLLLAATLGLQLLLAPAGWADELSDKGREIYTKNQRAVVTVQVVLKVSGARSRESKQDITGTVVDPSGLTVLSLSACDPTELGRRMYEEYKMDAEVTDIKILQEDSTEVPAEIVLRDRDLDLAFIRPKAKPASPLPAIDFSKSSPVQVLDQVIALNRLTRAANRTGSASVERISAVIQKPRTLYIPDSTMSATGLGSPVFALNGNVVGLIVMRAVKASAGSSDGGATSIILPAEEIVKGAKQAPEVKPDEEKKDAPKEVKDPK